MRHGVLLPDVARPPILARRRTRPPPPRKTHQPVHNRLEHGHRHRPPDGRPPSSTSTTGILSPLLFLFATTGTLLVLTIPHEKTQTSFQRQAPPSGTQQANRLSEQFIYCAWMANAVACVFVGALSSIFPNYLAGLVESGSLRLLPGGLGESTPFGKGTQFGWLVFILSFTRAATFFLLGHTHRWQHRFWLIATAQLASGLAAWTIVSTHSLLVMAACFSVIGLSAGLTFFSSTYYGLADPALKHSRSSIHEATVGIGNCLGPMTFAFLAGAYGVAFPFRWVPLFAVVAIAAESALLLLGRRRFPLSS